MVHDDVASGFPISTGFHRLTGCQRDPWDRGVTKFKSLKFFFPFFKISNFQFFNFSIFQIFKFSKFQFFNSKIINSQFKIRVP